MQMYYKVRRGWLRAVDGVSFSVEKGKALGIVGESGCGKSSVSFTILRLLPSNAKIFGGQVLFEGQDLMKLSEEAMRKIRWKKISMIFQAAVNALNPVQKIGDQLIEALQTHEEVSNEEAKQKVKELFKLVGLQAERIGNYPHEFSAGMRQRAIIAMSLICNPSLIIADEPTSALDVIIQDQIMRDIKRLQKERDITMMLISHDLALIMANCEKMTVMYAGHIMETGPQTAIYETPSHPYTCALLSSTPTIRGSGRKLIALKGTPPSLVTPPIGCRFEPRCLYAKDICKNELPEKIEVEKGHYSRCHFAKELDLRGWRKS